MGTIQGFYDRLKRVPLAVDKTCALVMLSHIIRRVEREKAGLFDPTEEQRKRLLTDHLKEFQRFLCNKGVSERQVSQCLCRLRKLVADRRWHVIGNISASGALEFLGQLRRNGLSAQTYNHYLKAAKQFTRWLVRDRRTLFDPLDSLSCLNVRTDRRHDRRALSQEEFARLIEAAHNGKRIEGMSGPDRAMMYVLAAWTGFRKGEIGSLTIRSLRLDDDPPTATVAACYSKRRRQDTQVLHPELVRQLREWLRGWSQERLRRQLRRRRKCKIQPRWAAVSRIGPRWWRRTTNQQNDRARSAGRSGEVDRGGQASGISAAAAI